MLRLDSSEMLPGIQKGEETAQILKTHTTFRHCGSQLVMITWTGVQVLTDNWFKLTRVVSLDPGLNWQNSDH